MSGIVSLFINLSSIMYIVLGFYTPGMPIMPRRAGTNRGKKYTTNMPLSATSKPVN
jgi:hypothetical protein